MYESQSVLDDWVTKHITKTYEVEHFSVCLFAIYVSSLVKCLLRCFLIATLKKDTIKINFNDIFV